MWIAFFCLDQQLSVTMKTLKTMVFLNVSGLWASEENCWMWRLYGPGKLWEAVVLVIPCCFYIISRLDKYHMEVHIPQVDRRLYYKGRSWVFTSGPEGPSGPWNIYPPVSHFKKLAPSWCRKLNCDICWHWLQHPSQAGFCWLYLQVYTSFGSSSSFKTTF